MKSGVLVCPILKEGIVYCLWCTECLITYFHRIKYTFLNATLMPLNYATCFLLTGTDSTIEGTSWRVNGTVARMNALRTQLMKAITRMQSAEPGCKGNFILMMLYLHVFQSLFYICIWSRKLLVRLQCEGGTRFL